MPWWFWPLAVLWTVPLIVCAWFAVAVAHELLADRRLARGEAERERRAAELCGRTHADPFEAQRGNPRARP